MRKIVSVLSACVKTLTQIKRFQSLILSSFLIIACFTFITTSPEIAKAASTSSVTFTFRGNITAIENNATKEFSTSFEDAVLPTGQGYFYIKNEVTGSNVQLYLNGNGHLWAEESLANSGTTCLGSNTNGRMEFLFLEDVAAALGISDQVYISVYVYFPVGFKWGSWLFINQESGGGTNYNPSTGIMLYDPYNDGTSPLQVCLKNNGGTGSISTPQHEGARTLWDPRGKWCHIEYFQTFDSTNAVAWGKIDGDYVFNYPAGSFYCTWHGATETLHTIVPGDTTRKLCPINLYTDFASTLGPVYWDDLEIWNNDPGTT
jgi:hypothetical protein